MWTAGARQRISLRLNAPIGLTRHRAAAVGLQAPRMLGAFPALKPRSALVNGPVGCALMSGLSRGVRRWPSWVCACVSGPQLRHQQLFGRSFEAVPFTGLWCVIRVAGVSWWPGVLSGDALGQRHAEPGHAVERRAADPSPDPGPLGHAPAAAPSLRPRRAPGWQVRVCGRNAHCRARLP